MNAVLDIVTAATNALGSAVFAALSWCSPVVALWMLSALTGIIMLTAWRYTSDQRAIADVRRQIAAHLLASRLFRDNLAVTFRAQRQILWQSLRLLWHSLRPMAILMVPFVLVMAQIGLRFQHRPAPVGRVLRVEVTVKDGADLLDVATRAGIPGALAPAPHDPCRVPALRTIDWRLTPHAPGRYVLAFDDGSAGIDIPLYVGDGFPALSAVRGGGWFERLLYSAEPTIPAASRIEAIRVFYPTRSTPIFGWDVHWLVSLIVLSIVFAVLARPILRVHI